jgi:hypothetical protein
MPGLCWLNNNKHMCIGICSCRKFVFLTANKICTCRRNATLWVLGTQQLQADISLFSAHSIVILHIRCAVVYSRFTRFLSGSLRNAWKPFISAPLNWFMYGVYKAYKLQLTSYMIWKLSQFLWNSILLVCEYFRYSRRMKWGLRNHLAVSLCLRWSLSICLCIPPNFF